MPAAVSPPPGNPRFELFDGLRAIAALSILASHAIYSSFYTSNGRFGFLAAGLDIGVPVFFVISGFLLYRPFVAAQIGGAPAPRTARFYRRRVLRIVPAYWLALTVISLVLGKGEMFDEWPTYYFFLQTHSPAFAGIPQAWSLCIEVSFYLVLPFYAIGMGRASRRLTPTLRVLSELVLLGALSIGSGLIWRAAANGQDVLIRQGLPHYWYWFAIGMALALISVWARNGASDKPRRAAAFVGRHPTWWWVLAISLFVALGAVVGRPDGLDYRPDLSLIRWTVQPLIALLLVLPAVFSTPANGGPGRLLSWRPIAWLGLISYGIYLWHEVIVETIFNEGLITRGSSLGLTAVLATALAVALTVPVAAISYYWIERPFLNLKEATHLIRRLRLFATRHFRTLVVAIAVASTALVAFGSRTGWFHLDDFPNLNAAHDQGMTLSFLLSPVMGERFSPGHRFLDWLVVQAPGHEWAVVVAVSSFCVGSSTLLLGLCVRRISGEAIVGLFAAVLFGTWSGWVAIALWFATSASTLPAIALSLAAVLASLRWDNGRRRSDFALAAALLIAACCFSVRAVVVPPILVMLLVVADPPRLALHLRDVWTRLRSVAALLCVMFVIPPLFVVLDAQASPGFETYPDPSLRAWAALSWHWMSDGVGAVMINAQPAVGGPPAVLAVVGIVILGTLAGLTIRGTRSFVVWLSTLGLLLFCGLEIGYARLAQFGLVIVDPLRYHEADLVVVCLLVPAAWVTAGRPFPSSPTWRGVLASSAAFFLACWLAVGATAVHRLHLDDEGPRAHATVRTIGQTLSPLVDGAGSASLLDDRTPLALSSVSDRELPRTIRTFDRSLAFTVMRPEGRPIVVTDDGVAHRITLSEEPLAWDAMGFCLRSTKESTFLGSGAAGNLLPISESERYGGRLILTLHFKVKGNDGRLGIVFVPSKTGYNDVEMPADRLRDGVRVVVPNGTTAVGFSAWGGLDACVSRPRLDNASLLP